MQTKHVLRRVRVLLHAVLFTSFLALGLGVGVLPQWLKMQGAQERLAQQERRRDAYRERLQVAATLAKADGARTGETRELLPLDQFPSYCNMVRREARRFGATSVNVTARHVPQRWRHLNAMAAEWGEVKGVRPMGFLLTVDGDFATVYRSIDQLAKQRVLWTVDRWTMRPQGQKVQTQVWGTVFCRDDAAAGQSPVAVPGAPSVWSAGEADEEGIDGA